MTLLEIFEQQFSALGRVPTVAKVSATLWQELSDAGKVQKKPVQIKFNDLVMPFGDMPSYLGQTFLLVDSDLGDHVDFLFSPA